MKSPSWWNVNSITFDCLRREKYKAAWQEEKWVAKVLSGITAAMHRAFILY